MNRLDAAAGCGRCLGYSVGRGPAEPPGRLRSPARTAPHRLLRTFRDWPTSPTNGGPPPPASPAKGRRGQLKGGGRGAPSPRGSLDLVPALTPYRPTARLPLLQIRRTGQRRRRPAPRWEPALPPHPGASQRPGVRVNFQAFARGPAEGREAHRGWPAADPPPPSASSPPPGPAGAGGGQDPSTRCGKHQGPLCLRKGARPPTPASSSHT